MKKFYVLLASLSLFAATAQSQVVINEIYGGGGNSGSVYRQDFIELYNNGTTAVDLSTWSVQYASATGTTWNKTNLVGSIAPQGYYLIQQAQGTGGTTNLPTPDVIGTTAMSGTAGKLFLVSNQTTLPVAACPTGAGVIDYVGFGTTANCFEGTGPTPAPSNSNSVQRIFSANTAQDTQNNNADFTAGLPSPMNAGGAADNTPPAITSLSPADNATNVSVSVTATLTFNETIAKGASGGTISIKRLSDDVTVESFDVSTSAVTVTGSTASFNISALSYNTAYYVEITPNAFKDLADNNFAGISGNSTWNFTTAASAPSGVLGTTYSFSTCSGSLPDGFSQFSVTGAQVWGCTTFGHDFSNPSASAPNGVQINGFSGGTNVPNEDWLISPAYDLTSTTFPLLSFWSRTAFNGDPLELKISTNYVSGNPNAATWTDLNGKFPGQASDIWTLSNNINLSAFKTTNVRIAFVYESSNDDGARWTLDDILIANSATPPPASLTLSTNDIQFGFVATPASSVNTFTFTGNDITAPVTLTATNNFTISKNNVDFFASLTYQQAEANNVTSTVYVKFTPPVNGQDFSGTVTVSTQGVADTTVTLKGTSIDPVNTLEVVNWNIEWFGSPNLGPTNDAQQQTNVTTILNNIGADIYGLTEIVSESRLQSVVSQMPGYAYKISNFGSHTNTSANPPSALAEAQKLAFVYKTSIFSNVTVAPLLSQGINSAADLTNPAYNYFASGRFPYMMTADVTLNGQTKQVRFVLIHGKANTSPTATSYARRKAGADTLAFTLNSLFPNDRIIVLGDFNDDLDQSITAGFTTTSYSAFTTDINQYFAPTLALSLAGKRSTVSYNDVIDHVVVSNEMQCDYMSATANILTGVTSLVTNYGSSTSDHYPVFTRFAFAPARTATFSYPATTYCQNAGTAAPTVNGTANGTFSSTPGLSINSTTGIITLSSSTPGTYTVDYTVAATTCDPTLTATSTFTVSVPPTAVVSYGASPYCQNAGTVNATLTGTTGGTFSSTTGLSINATTGAINTVTSTPGTYVVTYSIPATASCGASSVTSMVTITTPPTATIGYTGTPFCGGTGVINPNLTGTAGGTYSSTTGLSINTTTGAITLATSTPGTYVVTYRVAASGGCALFTTTTTVVVNAASIAPTGATASVTSSCGPGSVNLAVQFATGSLGTGATWKWYTGSCGGTLIGTGATLSNVAISGTTTYYVRAEGTCNTTSCATVTVTINEQPSITITAAPYTSLQPGMTTTLTANVVSGTSNVLTWYRNGMEVLGNSSNMITANIDQLGSYYARINTVNNCFASSNTIMIRDSASDKLFISPNPNRGLFSVRYASVNGQGTNRILTIFDAKGAKVFAKNFTLANTYSSMNVDLTGYGKGTYYIVVSDVNGNKLTEGNVLVL